MAIQKPLRLLFYGCLALAAVSLAGLALDPRTVGGAPAWLKPLKFALSVGVFAPTLGWLLGHLQGRERMRRVVTNLATAVLALELALITLQAARGVASHFNIARPIDGVIFNVMGVAIAALWISQIAVTVALLRQPFADARLAWSLRLGSLFSVLGAAVGIAMSARLAHSVGAPDDGAGMALTHWSLLHGDLRPAHFFGLHALQALPIVGWLTAKAGLDARRGARVVIAAGASYFALFALLLWQAARGQPLTALDGPTQLALAGWALATALALFAAIFGARGTPQMEAA